MNANRHWLRILLLLVLAAGIALAISYRNHFDAGALEAWIREAGILAPLLFILIYAIAAVLFLPGTVVTLAGGALFGPVLGTLYNLTGATLGATLAFLIARYLASDWVMQKAGGRAKQLINGVEEEGWRFVAFVRLVPLFPFNLLNYALGVTRLRLTHYIIASFVCMLPGAAAYTWLGYAGREALAGGEGIIRKALVALALLALVAFLPRLIGHLRRGPMLEVQELVKMRENGSELCILDVRTAADFSGEQGHIPEALNIPVEDLPARMGELADYTARPIAIVCRTDKRSAKAALLLNKRGFSRAQVVRGGMTRWHELGLPVTYQPDNHQSAPGKAVNQI
jgi:uncharacterized membrane protein YdjX (TVP38/TMEM64 family)/rhodanese-related sulfurtransferase